MIRPVRLGYEINLIRGTTDDNEKGAGQNLRAPFWKRALTPTCCAK